MRCTYRVFTRIRTIKVALALIVAASTLFVTSFDPIAAQAQPGARQITLLHTNALSGHIQEFRPPRQALQGGVARLLTKINELRAANPVTFLLSSGDDLMGTPVLVHYGGVAMGEIMTRLGYDAKLATHFDIMAGGSIDGFVGFRSMAGFRILNANIDLSALPDAQVAAQTVLIRQGVRIGVFGLAHEKATLLANFGEAATMRDTDAVIRENLQRFAAGGIDIVVLLSGLGMARDRAVAEAYSGPEGIDVIVGNAGDVLLGERSALPPWEIEPAGPYPLVYGSPAAPTLVVYAHEHGSYLGQLNLTFNDKGILTGWGGKLHFLGDTVSRNPELQLFVEKLAAGIVVNRIIIGETIDEMPGGYRDYPWQETPLGNLYADMYLHYGGPLGARIALVNSGSVWGGLRRGPITEADLFRIQPMSGWLILMDVTGAQLLAALENGVSTYGGELALSGRFLHVAGMTYAFDPTRPVGSRIVEALVEGQPVQPTATYSIIVNDFMANGGDEFSMLREGTNVLNTGIALTSSLQDYIKSHSPLKMPTLNRAVRIGL